MSSQANDPQETNPPADSPQALKTGVDFASELVVPGGSNLVEGNYVQGAIHVVLGIVAKSMFGLPGLIAVSANSFTKATTGRHIHEHLGLGVGQKQKEQTGQKASDSSQSALIPQSPPVSPAAYSSPQSAAKRGQPSSKKRPSSSKTSK